MQRNTILASLIVVAAVSGALAFTLTVPNESPDRGSDGVAEGLPAQSNATVSPPNYSEARADDVAFAVRMSRSGQGGYTTLPETEPNFHSTASFVTIDYLLDGDVEDREAVVSYVRRAVDRNFRNVSGTFSTPRQIRLTDYRDAAETLRALRAAGAPVNDTVDVSAFEAPGGKYCDAVYRRNGTCVSSGSASATVTAVTVANASDVPDETRAVVRREVQTLDAVDTSTLSKAYNLLRAADRLGISVESLDNGDALRAGLRTNETDLASGVLDENGTMNSALYFQSVASGLGVGVEDFEAAYVDTLEDPVDRHGGFHVLHGNYTEPQGTEAALQFVQRSRYDVSDVFDGTKLDRFVRHYSVSSGSYAQVVHAEPSILHTYDAIAVLDAVDREPVQTNRTAAWLEARASEIGYGNLTLPHMYHLHSLERRLEADVVPDSEASRRVRSAFESDLEGTSALELYYLVRTAELVGANVDEEAVATRIRAGQNPDGTFGSPPRTDTTYYAVMTLEEVGRDVPRSESLHDWLAETRAGHAGFRYRQGNSTNSRPDIWSTRAAVRILDATEGTVSHESSLERWVRGLYTHDGGFLRTGSAENASRPRLRSTRLALETLDALSKGE